MSMMEDLYQSPLEVNIISFIKDKIKQWIEAIDETVSYFTTLKNGLNSCSIKIDSSNPFIKDLISFQEHQVQILSARILFLDNQILRPLKEYSDKTRDEGNRILKLVHSNDQNISQYQNKLSSLIKKYNQTWFAFYKLKDQDPWLVEILLDEAIRAFIVAKEDYCKQLELLYKNCSDFDQGFTENLRGILKEFFSSSLQYQDDHQIHHSHHHSHHSSLFDDKGGREGEIGKKETRQGEEGSIWENSLKSHKLDWDWSGKVPVPPLDGFQQAIINQVSLDVLGIMGGSLSRSGGGSVSLESSASSLSSPASSLLVVSIRPIRMVKYGWLQRLSSTFLLGRGSWVTSLAIVTDSQFLHLYTVKMVKGIEIPKSGKKYGRKELVDSCTQILGIIDRSKLASPSLTIPLFDAQVFVDSEYKIVIEGKGGKKESEDEIKKYQLQAFNEEEMVDWCIAIKDVGKKRTPKEEENIERGDYIGGDNIDNANLNSNQYEQDEEKRKNDRAKEDLSLYQLQYNNSLEHHNQDIQIDIENPWG